MCARERESEIEEQHEEDVREEYRGTSLQRKRTPPEPYRRPMPRVLEGSLGGGRFLMGEVPLQGPE